MNTLKEMHKFFVNNKMVRVEWSYTGPAYDINGVVAEPKPVIA